MSSSEFLVHILGMCEYRHASPLYHNAAHTFLREQEGAWEREGRNEEDMARGSEGRRRSGSEERAEESGGEGGRVEEGERRRERVGYLSSEG